MHIKKTAKQISKQSEEIEKKVIQFLRNRHILAKKIEEGDSKSPDVLASYKDEVYRLEIKSRFEGISEDVDKAISVEQKDGDSLNWTVNQLKKAKKQFKENNLKSDLNILVLHVNAEGFFDITINDIFENLYGAKVIVSEDRSECYNLFGCYSGEFKRYSVIDAVIVFYDNHPMNYPNLNVYDKNENDFPNIPLMLVNPFSKKLAKLRASYIYGMFNRSYILHDQQESNECFDIKIGHMHAKHLDITQYKIDQGLSTNEILSKMNINCPLDFEMSGLLFTGIGNIPEISDEEWSTVLAYTENIVKQKLGKKKSEGCLFKEP